MPVAGAGPRDPGDGGVEERLRVVARLSDRGAVDVDGCCGGDAAGGLDPRTAALVRLAAVVALGSSSSACYEDRVRAAVELGATEQQVIDTMTSVASAVGMARLVSASPRVALGLGYDVEAAFEAVDPVDDRLAEREDRP